MKVTPTPNGFVMRLDKDELLCRSLLEFFHERKIKAAWITGIGGALWAEIGFYHLKEQEYSWKKLHENLEIASLQGNMSWKGDDPVLHLHGVFADLHYNAYAGHVKEAAIAGTCELLIKVLDGVELQRNHDDGVGLNILDL